MKTSELTGAELDYWVAKADGETDEYKIIWAITYAGYSPSTNWGIAGPLIEREEIHIAKGWRNDQWAAAHSVIWFPDHDDWIDGPTPLVAAMRAFVASKFGDTVPEFQP